MRKFKTKFKVYPWLTIYRDTKKKILNFDFTFHLLPSIDLNYRHDKYEKDWMEDEKESEYFSAFLMFSWLIFGITFDWRKDWEEDNNET